MFDSIIIGAGAAGLLAAITAAERGKKILVLDPNDRAGKKIRITGKGRCNVTNNCDVNQFLKNICTNPKFLKSALYAFPPSSAINFFESLGVPLKTERGNRVFPVSDNANEIADALIRKAKSLKITVEKARAAEILVNENSVAGVRTSSGFYNARTVIICTGGKSYPGTGSTGDGYVMAEKLGHKIIPPRASLVPLNADSFCSELQGLSLRNVELTLSKGNKVIYSELGEMLFTHFGISGPLVLTASTYLKDSASDYSMFIDLKPALSCEKLDERLLRDFAENQNKDFQNVMRGLLPQTMIPVFIRLVGISAVQKVNSITREQRMSIINLLKHFPIHISSLRPIEEAIVTSGGVDVREIDPRTMQSKLISGLYFAGEILDVDAFTGGYNLQIAWSTGYTAGMSV